MPADFDRCQRKGGRIRTITGPDEAFGLSAGEYRHVCWLDGKAHWGHKEVNHKERAMDEIVKKGGARSGLG